MGLKTKDLNQNKSQLLPPQFSCSSWLSEALKKQCWAMAEAGTQTICDCGDRGLEQRPAGLRGSTQGCAEARKSLKNKEKNHTHTQKKKKKARHLQGRGEQMPVMYSQA